MVKSRAELLQYAERSYEVVDGVRLQSLTELELCDLRMKWGKRYEESKTIDMVMRREVLVASIVDADGERIFQDGEESLLANWKGSITNKLYRAARALSGLDDETSEDEAKKSETTTVSD